MRIVVLTNADIGLYKFRKELIERLCKVHEVYIVLPHGEYVQRLEEFGCRFVPFEFNRHGMNPLADLKQLRGYVRILKKIKPDLVLTYTIKPNVYGGLACQSLKIPYIVNVTGLGSAVEGGGVLRVVSIPMYRLGIRNAQKVFFQNIENQEFMLKHKMLTGSYDLIPGSGVNLEQYSLLDYPKDENVHFVFIARILREKGIDQYLGAARYIREKYPFTRFHVCGNCEHDYKGLLTKLQREDIIVYHGRVSDISAIHRFSSCTILPTYYPEGMNNVLLESCACGRPIITTDRAGCREIVDDGVNGFVVKQKDSHDLIAKIEKFLALTWEQRRNMGLAARAKMEREFDREIVLKAYMKEISVVLDESLAVRPSNSLTRLI